MTYFTTSELILLLLIGVTLTYVVTRLLHRKRYMVYQHVRTRGLYVVLYEGKSERDSSRVVVYVSTTQLESPVPWVRDYNEFHDGRFESIGTVLL